MPPRFAVFCRYCDRKLAATAAETRGKAPYHAPVAPIDVETLPNHCKYPSNQLGVHFSGYGYTSSWFGVHFSGYGYMPSWFGIHFSGYEYTPSWFDVHFSGSRDTSNQLGVYPQLAGFPVLDFGEDPNACGDVPNGNVVYPQE